MAGDQLRIAVGRPGRRGVIRVVGRDDRDDLLGRAAQVRHANPVSGPQDRDRRALRGQGGAVVDVVHAIQVGGLPRVHLQDDPVGLVEPRVVVADRGGRDQRAVRGHAGHLDQRDVEVAEEAFLDHLRDVRQMDVQVLQLSGVDLGSGHRVGLVRHAQVDSVHGRQRAVQFGGGGRAGPDADREAIPPRGRFGGATDKRGRYRLRVAEAGEAAHPDVVAWRDVRRGVLRRHHLGRDGLALDA